MNRTITILDSTGNEIYKITDKLDHKRSDEMIISDNGMVDSIILQVINDMQSNFNYSREKVIKLLNSSDYKIYSTIDIEIQRKLNNKFSDRSIFTSTKKSNFNQSAMVIMDYEGNIKAVATGNNNDKTKNRASNTLLKVGSTIKPVAIYAPAIEKGLITFSSIIDDYPGNTFIDGQAVPWPTNYDNKYESNVTITDALKKSKNTIAVKVGETVGQDDIYNFLNDKVNYSTLDENNDKQLSALALGYFSNGISLDTLVSSYSMFGNGGYYSGKRYYTKVINSKNEEIFSSNNNNKIKAISEESATIMNRLLFNNISDEDSIIKNVGIDGIEVIGKTGTVGNDNDDIISQLFVGMTPEYIAGVWVGYDERIMQPNIYNYPSEIWQSVMSTMNFKVSNFELSKNVYEKEYCTETGLVKSESCIKTKLGYYKEYNLLDVCDRCK